MSAVQLIRVALLVVSLLLVAFLAFLSLAVFLGAGLSFALVVVVPLLATVVLVGLGNLLVKRDRPLLGLGLMVIPLVVAVPVFVRIYGETVRHNYFMP